MLIRQTHHKDLPYKFLIQILILAFLALGTPSLSFATTSTCPIRKGAPALSDETTNTNAIGEKVGLELSACTPSLLSGGIVTFNCIDIGLLAVYTNSEGKLTFSNPTSMPADLITAINLALSGDPTSKEPGGLTGAIPKLLAPGYMQANENGIEVDPAIALTRAEGQPVQGWVVPNEMQKQTNLVPGSEGGKMEANGDTSTKIPYYDVRTAGKTDQISDKNYLIEGTFGEVAPLYDRYGLLSQGLSFPTENPVELPDVNCPTTTNNLRQITIPETDSSGNTNPSRSLIWRAQEVTGKLENKATCSVFDLSCILKNISPIKVIEAKGNLDVASKVSLAGEAWSNMAGPSGAFATLLPPQTIFKTKDSEKPTIDFEHQGGNSGPTFSASHTKAASTLKISSLGNVGSAVNCMIYGLTAHPANAQPNICDEVLASGTFSGWPTEHGCITQGPHGSFTHKNAEAIDIGGSSSFDILGTPAMSTVSGVVETACNDEGGCGSIATMTGSCTGVSSCTGRWVSIIPDDGGYKIWYFHLDSVNAIPGQRVSPGTIIGAVGFSGNVFPRGVGGTHLHYEFKTAPMAPPKIPENPAEGLCW